MSQEIRLCRTPDGVRLAYALSGKGPPVVKVSHWMTHIERDWESPVWRHWLDFFSEDHTLVRYDERGCGLSDHGNLRLSLDDWVSDLETVVEAAGVDRFTLFGASQGGAIAIAYAARHPERVSSLVLYGAYAQGKLSRATDPQDVAEAEALIELTRSGWGLANPAYRRLFTMLFVPGGTEEQLAWFDDLQQSSTSGEHAARSRAVRYKIDVSDLAATLKVPTLLLHARDDALVPFEDSRHLASLIPGARLVSLNSANHILLENEPAWQDFCSELRAFLPAYVSPSEDGMVTLTSRERQVLALVAEGRDNDYIAGAFQLSARTIERHLSNSYSKLRLTGKAARAAAAARFATQAKGAQR